MTLLLVLGVVVIATILAALYLSLKSGRDDEPAPGGAGASDRQAGGGSRPGRSASLTGRVRSRADRGKAAGSSRRRFGGGDEDEYDVPDYVAARRSSRRAGGDRSSLVTAGTGHRADGRTAAGFDETGPARHAAYGRSAAGYDGYDAAADTRASSPMGPGPGTGPHATGGYDAGSGPSPGYGGEAPGGYRVRGRAGERGGDAGSGRGRDAGAPYGRYPGSAPEGTGGSEMYPPADRYSREDLAGGDFSPEDPAGGDFGAPRAGTPRGHTRPGSRRAGAPDTAPPADYDDTPAVLTNSPFSAAPGADLPSGDGGETGDSSPGGRRRITKFQKPQLRMGRSRQDYDNDPWPSADEIDGVSDDQFWSDLSSDKPLATTARTAQAPSDAGQPWAPGDGPGRPGPSAEPDSADTVSALVPADAPAMGRGRRGQRRAAEPEDSTEPRPRQQPDGGAGGAAGPRGAGGSSGAAGPRGPGGSSGAAGPRGAGGSSGAAGPRGAGGSSGAAGPGASGGSPRRGEPMRSPRGAGEDPLTGTSFSRAARGASDSRSYQGSRQVHRPSHGRPDASADETQTMRTDPRGDRAPGPAGAPGSGSPRRGAPGPGGRPGPGGTTGPGHRGYQDLPPSGLGRPGGLGGPNAPTGPNSVGGPASPGDPRGDGGYRTGARPAGPYPEGTSGHEPPARSSRHASPARGGRPPVSSGRPPASSGRQPAANGPRPPRPALPGPASGGPSYAPPGPASGGPSYAPPGYPDPLSPATNGGPSYAGTNGNPPYSGTGGESGHPGTSGTSPYPGTYGDSPQPEGAGGAAGYPRGRRSGNGSHRRSDGPYEDPYLPDY